MRMTAPPGCLENHETSDDDGRLPGTRNPAHPAGCLLHDAVLLSRSGMPGRLQGSCRGCRHCSPGSLLPGRLIMIRLRRLRRRARLGREHGRRCRFRLGRLPCVGAHAARQQVAAASRDQQLMAMSPPCVDCIPGADAGRGQAPFCITLSRPNDPVGGRGRRFRGMRAALRAEGVRTSPRQAPSQHPLAASNPKREPHHQLPALCTALSP